jgi:signal transduction histidine kinase
MPVPYQTSLLLPADFDSWRRQDSTFLLLNLFLLAALLLLHTLFAAHFGTPSPALIFVLAAAFLTQTVQLAWLQAQIRPLSSRMVSLLTCASIALNLVVAFLLALLVDRQDSPYFVLLVVPILLAAFRFSLLATAGVAALADAFSFFWVWHFAHHHAPVQLSEYFEAGSISLIFTFVGILVWLLVSNLRRKESSLRRHLDELELARERLLAQEKLAAVGRLSSAMAHEIRNPVAMISTSLATATRAGLGTQEREEMFDIAARESLRLERLTNEFLAYARPRPPQFAAADLDDAVRYVAELCRARACERGLTLEVDSPPGLAATMDAHQVQQALLNLALNALDASPAGGMVRFRARPQDDIVFVEVENEGAPIPRDVAGRLFEPFFTTKPGGTGLGLAIARNIACAHGGDLQLTANSAGRIRFTLTLPAAPAARGKA